MREDSSAPIRIRPVRREDAAGLQANCFVGMAGEEVAKRVEQDLRRAAAGTGLCLVADANGVPVATALVVCRQRRIGHVCNVVVSPAFRGAGLLGSLMDELARAAAGFGLKRLRLGAERENIAAIRAYKKLGFRQVEAADDIIWLEKAVGA